MTKLVAIEIDAKWKWIATDQDGEVAMYTKKPTDGLNAWRMNNGEVMYLGYPSEEAAKDWKNSLKRLEEIELED